MITKEWRDARWKLLIAAVPVLLGALSLEPYEELMKYGEPGAARWAAWVMWVVYSVGGVVALIPLAALLGASLISGEVSGGSIYLLLSKPASRTRLLLTKYGVCAGVLLTAAFLGAVLLVLVASVRGYPVENVVSFPGVALSAVLIWLGSLFVLGVALLASILFRGVLGSLVATALALLLIFALTQLLYTLTNSLQNWQKDLVRLLSEKLTLWLYWYSESLWYMGRSWGPTHDFVSTPTRFLVSTVAAAVPLLVALWLFRRKEY